MKTPLQYAVILLLVGGLAFNLYYTHSLHKRLERTEEIIQQRPPVNTFTSQAAPTPGPEHAPHLITSDKPFQPSPVGPSQPEKPKGPTTTIKFKKTTHDFGRVKQNSENVYWFEFTNAGKEPLLISNAQASCGCTVPEYPKEPIPPGGKGKIKVVYSPGSQEGHQTKNVTVTANTDPPQTILTITANVVKE
ncbi:MAG: DUF1573 domain-containing protein [Flavobacteriales bacterium]|nr:DUF1573 domain-containing protein [Flavobacteriales bacterium]MDW8410766.1 DUF1573 domain-containing protein [Flavobacteriales bacterium]